MNSYNGINLSLTQEKMINFLLEQSNKFAKIFGVIFVKIQVQRVEDDFINLYFTNNGENFSLLISFRELTKTELKQAKIQTANSCFKIRKTGRSKKKVKTILPYCNRVKEVIEKKQRLSKILDIPLVYTHVEENSEDKRIAFSNRSNTFCITISLY